jgi:prepilin-type N-terminal cleavage/methylation domain-containing protein
MKKRNGGFTLIELLVAVMIFSIIASVVYSTFSMGTSVWKRTKRATAASMAMHAVLEDLGRDLRSAVAYDHEEDALAFIGENDKLYFCCLSGTVTDTRYYSELYRSYYGTEASRQSGRVDLIRKKVPLRQGGFLIDELEGQAVIQGLDELTIEYGYRDAEEEEIVWQDAWEPEEETDKATPLPQTLRIRLKQGDVIVTKYMWIPIGQLLEAGME